jgi:hypothetical protein
MNKDVLNDSSLETPNYLNLRNSPRTKEEMNIKITEEEDIDNTEMDKTIQDHRKTKENLKKETLEITTTHMIQTISEIFSIGIETSLSHSHHRQMDIMKTSYIGKMKRSR